LFHFFNITKRNKMMTNLINSEEKIKAIFNNHFQLAGLLDVDGRLLMINQTALSFIDVSEDQVLGKYFWQTPWFRHSKELQKEVKIL
jgi:PAS domain-containing protein